jgi:hypothetical protein
MEFKMKIDDIFNLSSGDTVFVGSIEGTDKLIKFGQKAQLLIDGLPDRIIETRGEWHQTPRNRDGKRSISVLNAGDLTSEFVKQHDCTLISLVNQC